MCCLFLSCRDVNAKPLSCVGAAFPYINPCGNLHQHWPQEMDHYQALGRCLLLSGNIKHALGGG